MAGGNQLDASGRTHTPCAIHASSSKVFAPHPPNINLVLRESSAMCPQRGAGTADTAVGLPRAAAGVRVRVRQGKVMLGASTQRWLLALACKPAPAELPRCCRVRIKSPQIIQLLAMHIHAAKDVHHLRNARRGMSAPECSAATNPPPDALLPNSLELTKTVWRPLSAVKLPEHTKQRSTLGTLLTSLHRRSLAFALPITA